MAAAALVFLESPTILGPDVATVALNSDSFVPRVGEELTAMGGGDTAISDHLTVLPDVLHKVQVNVVSNDECEGASGSVDGRRDDYSCASDVFSGVYARLLRTYDWIAEQVCAGSDYAAEAGFDCSGGSAPAPAPSLPSNDKSRRPTRRPVIILLILLIMTLFIIMKPIMITVAVVINTIR